MKKYSKIICMLLVMVAVLNVTTVFAKLENALDAQLDVASQGTGAYNILSNVLNSVLSVLAWFGYAIAIGALVLMGIKYVMSGAQEKANLKGSFSKYLIGIALIVFCSTIASAVANIANTDGSNTAEGLIKRALGLGGATVGESSGEHGGGGTTLERGSYKLGIAASDGTIVDIKINGGETQHTAESLPGEISQFQNTKIKEGDQVTLTAEPTSPSGKEFKGWARVDEYGNVIEWLTKDLAYEYIMGREDTNIMAVYEEKTSTGTFTTIVNPIGSVPGRAPANITVKENTPCAIVTANAAGAGDASYTVRYRNQDKKTVGADDSKLEKNGEKYSEEDNGVIGTVYPLDASASNGSYIINLESNTGNQAPQNLSITQYDKDGNSEEIGLTVYYAKNSKYYDANGTQISNEELGKNGVYAISYDDGRDIDIYIDLDIENHSYIINADCIGNAS